MLVVIYEVWFYGVFDSSTYLPAPGSRYCFAVENDASEFLGRSTIQEFRSNRSMSLPVRSNVGRTYADANTVCSHLRSPPKIQALQVVHTSKNCILKFSISGAHDSSRHVQHVRYSTVYNRPTQYLAMYIVIADATKSNVQPVGIPCPTNL